MSAIPVPSIDRTAINRTNSQHSTGPRTESGKQRSSLNALRLLSNLGIQAHRLSRQFQKTLDTLSDIQADRRDRERRQLKDAAAILELHKHKQPSDHGFVFSKDQVERHSELLMRQNEARQIAYVRFEVPPQLQSALARSAGSR